MWIFWVWITRRPPMLRSASSTLVVEPSSKVPALAKMTLPGVGFSGGWNASQLAPMSHVISSARPAQVTSSVVGMALLVATVMSSVAPLL